MSIVTIEKVIFGGQGLARTDQGVVFVNDVLPGEVVEVSPPVKVRGALFSKSVKLIEASEKRRIPLCPCFGVCGGCDWQYISYETQVELKRNIYRDSFRKISSIAQLPDPEIFTSPETGYRIRARAQIRNDGRLGFFRKNSNDIVAIQSCPLLSGKLNQLFTNSFPVRNDRRKNELKLIEGDTSVASDPIIAGFTESQADITIDGKLFRVNGGDFFQSNCFVNERLGTWFRPFVGGGLCIDLYGGCGFFSMMVASRFKKGLLIESVRSQVEHARSNFFNNGIHHFKAICSDSENLHSVCSQRPDCLIVDPPRPGLTPQVRSAIAALKPAKIVYVSCNISTQARDCEFFIKEMNYRIIRSALFDCYPNTSHIESVMILEV
ncbi:MAG: class I SAM-dependent RNA methyltransferase [Chitinispirillaceae bacterium]|nr:class I SAM-dependent RNA methyltransferase [Chitinispirillaceae bacterium]